MSEALHLQRSRLDRIRLDENLTYAQLAEEIRDVVGDAIDASVIYKFLNMPERHPYDRTVHKITRFLDQRKPRARRRSA